MVAADTPAKYSGRVDAETDKTHYLIPSNRLLRSDSTPAHLGVY